MVTRVKGGMPWLLLIVIAVCHGLLTACAQPAPPLSRAAAQDATSAAAPQTGAHGSGGTAAESPADRALRLEALLAQHSVLAADMMRGRIRGDEDFGQAANAAVTRNTDDLAQVIGLLSGDEAANTFRTRWAEHVTELFEYSRGLATNDAALRDHAREELIEYEAELADLFVSASEGRLPAEAARAAVLTHVDHLLQQADAYAAGDYQRAGTLYREGYAHTFGIGHGLATTLLPPDQAATLEQPSWRLRSELQRLLGEHVALAVAALRSGATNGPDFPAAGEALNGNTRDLTAAVGALFGAQAAEQFMGLWADHIDQLVNYTGGVAGNDPGRREAALSELRAFENEMAALLDRATGSAARSSELAAALLAHDDMLTRQVDAFAGRDYRQAHDLAYGAYQDMVGLSRQLSDAFGETVAARLPQGGVRTGAGGMAEAPGPR